MRAPFQVLVLPYSKVLDNTQFCIFKRESTTGSYWQGIAGGGENDDSIITAAIRESKEEANINSDNNFYQLSTYTTIPTEMIFGKLLWGLEHIVIPEYTFGVELINIDCITLSDEHTEFLWCNFNTAMNLLHWDSNKRALFELNYRIQNNLW